MKPFEDRKDELECPIIHLKEDFKGRGNAGGLHFTPESTLITTNAIHNAGHIPEMSFEFLFYNLIAVNWLLMDDMIIKTHIGVVTLKKNRLVKLSSALGYRENVRQSGLRLQIIFMISRRTVIISRKIGLKSGYCAEEKDRIEVDVL